MFFKRVNIDNITLDLDSTVITRYGNQEGAKRGYNPKKPGRNSHHPLIAFIDQTKMVANAWLRSGNTSDINNVENFLDETLEIALKDKKVALVRADSGFYSNRFLEYLEERDLNYIVAVKFYQNIQREIGVIKDWIEITKGLEVANFYFKADSYNKTRRYIIVRKKVENYPNSGGKLLFDIPTYKYSAYVTNINLPVDQIYNIYNTRADAENRIKELKYDFGVDSFCLKEFYATEASFRFIMIAYNILAFFKHMIINSNMQLKTLKAYGPHFVAGLHALH